MIVPLLCNIAKSRYTSNIVLSVAKDNRDNPQSIDRIVISNEFNLVFKNKKKERFSGLD
tara:strand:+ start:406 stop:582 length:177 start_codon:yes stop_codon:yes gene_type:complete